MKKILAIGASNSSKSINKVFATHIANQMQNAEVIILDWDQMVLPLYGPDLEGEQGIPKEAHNFLEQIRNADAVVLSLAEYNGLPTSAFKNLWDWTSRIEQKFWQEKPMFLASTSPGGRGGKGALGITENIIPHFGGNVIASFSLPAFGQNFQDGNIQDETLLAELTSKIEAFQQAIG